MSPELRGLDVRFVPAVEWILAVARAYCGGASVTSTRRSTAEQIRLYQRYRGAQVCRPGTSAHELGQAVDLVVAQGSTSEAQAWLGAVWNRYVTNTWSSNDPVHFAGVRGCLP